MITAIATIAGALTGIVPGILQFASKKADNAHAIELRKLEIEAAKTGGAVAVDVAQAQSDIQQQSHIYDFANEPTHIGWVDAVTVLVRPWITLVVFHMWIAVDVALLIYGIKIGLDFEKMITLLWDDSSKDMLAAIVGFWFGNRMLVRGQQMAATVAVSTPPVKVTPAAPAKPDPLKPMKKIKNEVDPKTGIIPLPPGDRT